MNIFVFTASNSEAQRHLLDTIVNSVEESLVKRNLVSEEFQELKSKSNNLGYYCWGAVPGSSNLRNWGQLKENDYILTYYDKKIHYYSNLVYKVHNRQLAEELWGSLNDGKTWEYIYFLTKPKKLENPILTKDFPNHLQSVFQGFAKIKDSKVAKILSEYGSVENFLLYPYRANKYVLDISTALSTDWIQMLMNSAEFAFAKGAELLAELENFDARSDFYENLRNKFVTQTKGKDKGFVDFLNELEPHSEAYKFTLLAGKLIAHIDERAANKKGWNSYPDTRILARSAVRQNHWFEALITLKEHQNDYSALSKQSVVNALQYLKTPREGSTLLSEKHRALVSKHIFKQSTYKSDHFTNDLITYFKGYNIKVVNEDNRTAVLSSILYHPDVKKLWNEKEKKELSIHGLIASDNTGWHKNFIENLAKDAYDSAIVWWDKNPSGTKKTLAALKEKIQSEGSFEFYFSAGNNVNYKARVVDFSLPDDYPEKNWNLIHNIYAFHEDFEEYKEENDGKTRQARIVYLIDQLEELKPPLAIDAFEFYKDFTSPTQNNVQPFVAVKKTPNIWFVCQGTTYNDKQGKEYLWAPEKDKGGGRKYYWDKLKTVKQGDYIFHYSDGVRGISQVQSDAYSAPNPMEETQWMDQGTQVGVENLYEFERPIHYTELSAEKAMFESLLTDGQGPFDSKGEVKQGYLFSFNQEAGKLVRRIYGKHFPEPFESFFKSDAELKTEKSVKDIVAHVNQYILGKGFYFDKKDIANFYLSLKTKPFVILAGISGTGKTQLARLFIEAIGYRHNCEVIPVRPDWTDNSDLIGYTDLSGNFQSKPMLQLIQKALQHKDEPFFLILDEMNLARVEYYFSDFLSVIESREWKNDQIISDQLVKQSFLQEASNKEQFSGLHIPDNVFVIGTVNMDETTHPFSRKVLDRANSIEMNQVDLNWKKMPTEKVDTANGIYNDFLRSEYINSKDIGEKERSTLDKFVKLLQDINEILEEADLQFAYRVRDEMAFYLLLNKKYGLLTEKEALDFQLMQKVLPRIQGSSISVKLVLLGLVKCLEGIELSEQEYSPENLQKKLPAKEELKYPQSLRKIRFMLRRYHNDGFTSFWQ